MKTISIFLILGIIITVIAATNSGISNIYSKYDLNRVKDYIVSKQDSNGLFNGELKDTYYGVSALQRIQETIGKSKELCKNVKSQLTKNSDIESVFYAVSILSEAKCGGLDASVVDIVTPLLKTKLASGNLIEIYQAVNTIFTLQTAKLNVAIDNNTLEAAVGKLVSLMDAEEGTFKLSDSEQANLANTGLAYFTLARLSHRLKSPEADKLIAKVVAKVGSVMSAGDETQGALSFGGNLATTSSILHGVLSLSSVNDQITDFVSAEQINSIGEYLVKQTNIESLSDAYYLILGLKRCQKNSINQPLHLNLLQTVYSNQLDNVKLQVQDILGADVPSKVVISQAVLSSARTSPIISNVELTSADSKTYSVQNFESGKFKLGSYVFDFKITPVDTQFGAITVRRVLTVSGAVAVKDFKVAVADTKEALGTATSTVVEFGKKLKSPINANGNQTVKFFFRIVSNDQPFQVKQAAIQLYSSAGIETVIPVAFSVDAFSVTLGVKDIAKRLGNHAGLYNADLIIGDNTITPIKWNFAELQFDLGAVEPTTPLTRFTDSQPITHKFRTPEKRPPQTISDGFTILVLSPALIFLLGLVKVGINFKRFPTNNLVAFVSTLVFICCICSVGLLIVNYWIGSTMDVTLKNLGLLLIPTVFFGHQTLSYMNQERSLLKEKEN
ncbi:hypothetical protein CYY_008271 [Polysphondylium violaceum]|uniref:Dolichyl-diphosphooligosaccharide--protein glycosyltransferase subunit 2 n=1 Tax=Polysphondylium violaceum TaxID=133409 RepID=A0A8J4PPH8_9MYCE|nr:hypothetical protein CYY_008271 [Polysphondylium violaceum]